MIQGAIYVVGVGLSRFAPIMLGALIAHKLGEDAYTQFVLFLTISNVVTNFSLMGTIPRILSLPSDSEDRLLRLQYGGFANLFFSLIILSLLFLFGICLPERPDSVNAHVQILIFISILFYCLGYFLLSLASAILNRSNEHRLAGYLWFYNSLIIFGLSVFLIIFDNYYLLLLLFSLMWMFLGLYSWFKITGNCIKLCKKIFKDNFLVEMAKSTYSALFGLPFLIIFFLFGKQINASPDIVGKSAFFLGFQLFTVVIFIPGILGGILVPKLSQNLYKQKKVLISNLNFYYLIVGIIWLAAVCLALPLLFRIYGIVMSNKIIIVVLLWQISGIIASLGAIQNQLLVSQGKYTFLLIGSLLWAIIAVSIAGFIRDQMLGKVVGILGAYLVLQFVYYYKNNIYILEKRVSNGA
ncbi:hypothetical protein [Legionella jamestowniensis]|uniref:hypothetical protein n=1 Tax=Legionella jamestowniensis TaxID=455 RepID=UPI001040E903|nr:hypothetical protein [Legionella jamestowniensis]